MTDMRHHHLAFHGVGLVARADGAIHWPEQDALIVADMHLGKHDCLARRGGALIPPYGDAVTLVRLARALEETRAQQVIVLGDGFDDTHARLAPQDSDALAYLMNGRDWIWIAGNHDPVLPGLAEGFRATSPVDLLLGPLCLRHIAQDDDRPDISGHYHPVVPLSGLRRPAFLIGAGHLILPAFGAYTGGLDATSAALVALVPQGRAVLTGSRALVVPWPLPAVRKGHRAG